ncbi:aldo/keto reductase [Cerasicoccus frondis]|uniref:aldo/keto reductase n=1 Tax=Cerasicoccus frondis TaxID=490090 RepID=UPI002852DB4B|nr:aldo/keto reductase [Cerasicoccus frondis]
MSLSRRHFIKSSVGTAALIGAGNALAQTANEVTIPKRKFGRHDDMLTVVGVGGHTLYYAGSQKEATEITQRAIDLGVNFFDNAWDYHGGRAEEYLGIALQGRRDEIFLMSKCCVYHNGKYPENKAGAMQMLEDSLRRLKTDHLDLWMLHNVSGDDAEKAYAPDGMIAALDLAKEQGKVRYTGFTGHTDPAIHVKLIEGGYDWDATLMPVSVVNALNSREFERKVMPLCNAKQIAVLGMKGFGGSRRTHLHGKTNITEVLRYSLSYPEVCTHLVGIDKLPYLDAAVAASPSKPMTPIEREEFAMAFDKDQFDDYAKMESLEYYDEGLGGEQKV